MLKAIHCDDLGRVVIPVHIRRALGISPATPLLPSVEGNRVIFEVDEPSFSSNEVALIATRLLASHGIHVRPDQVAEEITEMLGHKGGPA